MFAEVVSYLGVGIRLLWEIAISDRFSQMIGNARALNNISVLLFTLN